MFARPSATFYSPNYIVNARSSRDPLPFSHHSGHSRPFVCLVRIFATLGQRGRTSWPVDAISSLSLCCAGFVGRTWGALWACVGWWVGSLRESAGLVESSQVNRSCGDKQRRRGARGPRFYHVRDRVLPLSCQRRSDVL